jgi:hypothetical protein
MRRGPGGGEHHPGYNAGPPGPPPPHNGGSGNNMGHHHNNNPLLVGNIHQCEIHMKPRKRKNFLQAWLNKFPSRAKKIDVLSRVIFPAIFAFFNISYWTFYLTQEANTEVN